MDIGRNFLRAMQTVATGKEVTVLKTRRKVGREQTGANKEGYS